MLIHGFEQQLVHFEIFPVVHSCFVIPQLAQVHFIMVRPFLVLTYRSLPGTHSVCFFFLTQYDFTIIYNLDIFEVIDDESMIDTRI